MFSTLLENSPSFSLKLTLSSVNSFSLEESKSCRLGNYKISVKTFSLLLYVYMCRRKSRSKSPIYNDFISTLSQTRPCFTCLEYRTVGKREIARNSNFSCSHSVFYPFGELTDIFIKINIVVCKLFLFGRV